MHYLDLLHRASQLADIVDADRVTWDNGYRQAVIDFVSDEAGGNDAALRARGALPPEMVKTMDELGLAPATAWRKAEGDVRIAARTCVHCGLSEACRTALPGNLGDCPNHQRLTRIGEQSISDRDRPAAKGCPSP